jgi:hypothetical protein
LRKTSVNGSGEFHALIMREGLSFVNERMASGAGHIVPLRGKGEIVRFARIGERRLKPGKAIAHLADRHGLHRTSRALRRFSNSAASMILRWAEISPLISVASAGDR